jgi:lipopolysaccharide biosynthesis glycosyltransferase
MDQHIYTAADGNYSLQAQVLALSLKKTQRLRTFLTVFGNGWDERERRSLLNLSNETLVITQEEVPTEAFSSIKLASGFPLATAYNVLGPKFLLKPSLRYLYVDADTVVRKDLRELWEIEMSYAVGATLDAHIGWASSPSMWRPWIEEGLDPLTPYLNTGVLLIDVDRWNAQKLTERVVEKLSMYQLPCVDQDAINLVLKGNFDVMQPKYNSMPYHILSSFRYVDAFTPQDEIEAALADPHIVHFHRSFLGKPWELACAHPGKKLWRSLASEVRPKWRKTLDLKGLARRRAAKWAKMLRIDARSAELDSL